MESYKAEQKTRISSLCPDPPVYQKAQDNKYYFIRTKLITTNDKGEVPGPGQPEKPRRNEAQRDKILSF